jgi:hypothetical protein
MLGKASRYFCRAANVELLRALALQDVNVSHLDNLVDPGLGYFRRPLRGQDGGGIDEEAWFPAHPQ